MGAIKGKAWVVAVSHINSQGFLASLPSFPMWHWLLYYKLNLLTIIMPTKASTNWYCGGLKIESGFQLFQKRRFRCDIKKSGFHPISVGARYKESTIFVCFVLHTKNMWLSLFMWKIIVWVWPKQSHLPPLTISTGWWLILLFLFLLDEPRKLWKHQIQYDLSLQMCPLHSCAPLGPDNILLYWVV